MCVHIYFRRLSECEKRKKQLINNHLKKKDLFVKKSVSFDHVRVLLVSVYKIYKFKN